MRTLLLIGCLVAPAALAAPKIERLTVQPSLAEFSGGKAPEVQISISVSRTRFDSGSCDAQLDLGDGSRPRTVDFGVAGTKIMRHTYNKGGTFRVSVKGIGRTPCEGMQEASLTVKGTPKPEPKKKYEPKKKPEPKKKAEPKKKPDPKKKDEKKPEPG